MAIALALVMSASMAQAQKGPSQQEINDTLAKVEEQQKLLREQNTELAAKQEQLDYLSEQAGLALEAFDTATKAYDQSMYELKMAREALEEARKTVETTTQKLGSWAATAYRKGSSTNTTLHQLRALNSGHMASLAEQQWAMRKTGQNRADLVAQADAAKVAADYAERVALDAEKLAQQRKTKAAELKLAADAAVAKQLQQVQAMKAAVAATENTLVETQAKADRLAEAQRIADAERRAAISNAGSVTAVMGPVGSCKGGNLTGYGNGRLPKSALCPLWGAPGHFLRADAAAAYEKLSKAYARRFGRPISMTDSYRSYAAQVDLKQRKPHLSARPGTSNHGWGRAIDLGGGINNFGSVQHKWMRANAPLYGWYHPQWARANGSKPEAWHWEYAPR